MSEPSVVTTDLLRDLLAAPSGAVLALVGGRAQVVDDPAEADDALEVVARSDLLERVGDDPDADAMEAEAAALTIAAQQLGG